MKKIKPDDINCSDPWVHIRINDVSLITDYISTNIHLFQEGSWYFVLTICSELNRCALEIFHPDGVSEAKIEVTSWIDITQKPKKIAKLLYGKA